MNADLNLAVNDLLKRVQRGTEELRGRLNQEQPRLAKDFNPIGLFEPWENDLSRLIADFLSPQGGHGQGALFLRLFVKCFNVERDWVDPENARVEIEARTSSNRRIDIKITFGVPDGGRYGVIGIENKPWAADQEDQVHDYSKYLEKSAPGKNHLIYLSGNGRGPSEYSLGPAREPPKNLSVVAYVELAAWLRECAAQALASRVKFFMEELVNYIEREFNGAARMDERTLIVREAIESPGALEAAFAVSAAISDIKSELFNSLFFELKGLVNGNHRDWVVEKDFSRPENSKYKGISIWLNRGDSYRFRLAFEERDCNSCMIGVCKSSAKIEDRPGLNDIISGELGQYQTSKYWPWYRFTDPANWGSNPSVWMKIKSGQMAEDIFQDFEGIYRSLQKQADSMR